MKTGFDLLHVAHLGSHLLILGGFLLTLLLTLVLVCILVRPGGMMWYDVTFSFTFMNMESSFIFLRPRKTLGSVILYVLGFLRDAAQQFTCYFSTTVPIWCGECHNF